MQCDYHDAHNFTNIDTNNALSCLHINCRGLSANWENFKHLICELHSGNSKFDFIGICEAYRCENDMRLKLPGYNDLISRSRTSGSRGGVGLFINDNISYKIRDDISVFIPHVFESVFVEMESSSKNMIIGVIYRPNTAPKADLDMFSTTLFDIMDTINAEHQIGLFMGDMNIDLLKTETQTKTNDYLDNIFLHGFLPVILKPTRISSTCATLIDHIYTNNLSAESCSGISITDVADHFATYMTMSYKRQHKSKVMPKFLLPLLTAEPSLSVLGM
jgi:hypothetical protein